MSLRRSTHSGSKRVSQQQMQQSSKLSSNKQRFWPCPVCSRSFSCFLIDDHVLQCLDLQTHVESGTVFAGSFPSPVGLSERTDCCVAEKTSSAPSAVEEERIGEPGVLSHELQLDSVLHSQSGQRCHCSVAEVKLDGRDQNEVFRGKPSLDMREICSSEEPAEASREDFDSSYGKRLKSQPANSGSTCHGSSVINLSPCVISKVDGGELACSAETRYTPSKVQCVAEVIKDGNGRVVERPPPGFKLYQRQKESQARLSMFCTLSPSAEAMERKPNASVLRPGMVLFRNWLDLGMQQLFVSQSQKAAYLFHRPLTSGGGKYHIYSMCWGPKWDARSHRYVGTGPHQPLPDWMSELSQKIALEAQQHTSVYPADSQFSPNVGLVNFYPVKAAELGVIGLGGHQDLDDSNTMPVVSVSVGDSMTFFYRGVPPLSRRKSGLFISVDEKAAKNCEDGDVAYNREHQVVLNSGDVLVFGGESRLIYHGTRHVQAGTRPPGLHMVPGRLNFTFRQTDGKI